LLRQCYLCSSHSQLGSNLGFFIADNAGPNNTAIRAILRDLDPDGCLTHIINLVAKAFLFGKDVESLEIHQDRSKAEIKELLEVRQDWLDHGPYGKLHKTVEFIRDTPQRRDEWFSIANSGIEDQFEGTKKIEFPRQDNKNPPWAHPTPVLG
jgi:hypothetical protein